MGLRENLLTKPRETSGSSSSNRFDFQKDWALCHLLDLHESNRDYILVFEHHEDVIVLFLSDSPETVQCYQIKTKSPGRWSLTDLLRRKKLKSGDGFSILGKMYENVKVFGDGCTTVNFVSNAIYTLTLDDGTSCDSKDCVCLGEIAAADLAKIRSQLMLEHALGAEPTFGKDGHVHVTTLSLHDHATHATGRLERFLAKTRPGKLYSVSTLYRTLFDEIRRLSNYEWDAASLNTILRNKAISRTEFQSLLDSVPEAKTFDSFWIQAGAQLTSEGIPFSELMSLRKACQTHEVKRMDPGNDIVQQLVAAAAAEAATVVTDSTIPTLRAKLDASSWKVNQRKITGSNVYDQTTLKAMVLMAIYEY